MARKIIILDQTGLPSDLRYNVAFWLTVPAARQPFVANAALLSRVKNATAPEITAIQAGQIIEQVFEASYPIGTAIAIITADLIAKYNAAQTISDATNPWNRYGTNWDGNVWQQVTVA